MYLVPFSRYRRIKLVVFPTPPLFDAPDRGDPVKISGRNLPRKNYRDGATVRWKLHDPNFNHFRLIHQTDRRAKAYTRYSIYAVERKNRRFYFWVAVYIIGSRVLSFSEHYCELTCRNVILSFCLSAVSLTCIFSGNSCRNWTTF